jgi:hypothetical protein
MLYRRVFKTMDLGTIEDPAQVQRIVRAVGDAITLAGGEAAYEMFYDEATDTPYENYPDSGAESAGILVSDHSGALREFSTISPMVGALGRQLSFRRLHIADRWRELAATVARQTN